MQIDRRGLFAAFAGLSAIAAATPDPTEVIDIWPDGPPGGVPKSLTQKTVERAKPGLPGDRAVFNVTRPTLTVFRPAEPNGRAVLLTPGGSYGRVVVDKEGFELGRWLAARGVTAHVLYYRLPADGWAAGPDAALQDAQRALRLVRADRSTRGPVGLVGFSAGGHVAAMLATRHGETTYPARDATDRLSARPDAVGLVYPLISMRPPAAHAESRGNLLGQAPTEAQVRAYSLEDRAGPQVPPTFLVHAHDDATVPIDNSLLLHAALRRAGIPVEAHYFQEGGHGFGLRGTVAKPIAVWPELFWAWWMRRGLAA
ncbi:MAG: alpha/beta hydrolase [Phenylobacterium sp.]